MSTQRIIVIECDKCHTQDTDPTKFLHVAVSEIVLDGTKRKVPKILSSRDLCIESCVGLPGVNRDA